MPEPLPPPFLKFEDGDGREIPLCSGNVWTITRTQQNAVVLPDDMVSRNHVVIEQLDGDAFRLIDLGSRNGSFVNGHRVTAPVALSDGDRLSFGDARLCFHNPARWPPLSRRVFLPAHQRTAKLSRCWDGMDGESQAACIQGERIIDQKRGEKLARRTRAD